MNWNTRDLLADCLQSVFDTVQGLEFELLVVDNGSGDGSVAMVRERFPAVQLIENRENVGFARANNQAIGQARGRYVMLLNSDACLERDAARQIVDFFDTHPGTGIVGASLVSPDGHRQVAYGPLPSLASEVASLLGVDKGRASNRGAPGGGRLPLDSSLVETGWVHGACLTARRQTLEQIGLFDEQFFMFNEEVDLCRRAGSAGWAVVHLPSAGVIHREAGSTGPTAERYLMLYGAKLRYFAKHHRALTRRGLLWAIRLTTWLKLVAYTLQQRLGLDRKQETVLWSGIARGLPGLAQPGDTPNRGSSRQGS